MTNPSWWLKIMSCLMAGHPSRWTSILGVWYSRLLAMTQESLSKSVTLVLWEYILRGSRMYPEWTSQMIKESTSSRAAIVKISNKKTGRKPFLGMKCLKVSVNLKVRKRYTWPSTLSRPRNLLHFIEKNTSASKTGLTCIGKMKNKLPF